MLTGKPSRWEARFYADRGRLVLGLYYRGREDAVHEGEVRLGEFLGFGLMEYFEG